VSIARVNSSEGAPFSLQYAITRRSHSPAAFDSSSLTDATLRPASQLCLPLVSEASHTLAFRWMVA
jgi:hypothetical protein